METERPFLVELVCWILIIANMYGLYVTMKQLGSPDFVKYLGQFPYEPLVAVVILFATYAIPIVCAICMYERIGWARFVYLGIMIPYFIQNYFAVSQAKNPVLALHLLEGEFVLYAVSIVILFLPKAHYFYHPPQYIDGRD